MYTNSKEEVYVGSHSCKYCKNSDICKWVGNMNDTKEAVDKIDNKGLSPIVVSVVCRKFEKKPLAKNNKQDSIFSGTEKNLNYIDSFVKRG